MFKVPGVLIDNKLNWKSHISQTNFKLSKGLSIITSLRHFVPKALLRNLHFAFVQSNINYCLLNWSSASQINLKCIQVSMNKAVRLMLFKHPREHATHLYNELNILPFEEGRKLDLAKFMWKIMNGHN